jgi:hypothetical protein
MAAEAARREDERHALVAELVSERQLARTGRHLESGTSR